ncbi:MAG TPA: S8/S53 family peptidase [Woeseiaceae bacterium]|nr:S8/S53 family peptidase [Woeseiaceae bacterium]
MPNPNPCRPTFWPAILLSAWPLAASAADPLRITSLVRCGDLLDTRSHEFCLRLDGRGAGEFAVILGGETLTDGAVAEADGTLSLMLDRGVYRSGPVRVKQAGRQSNPVWLSMQDSATIAAGAAEVARNSDGITTYVDLVSILVEEAFDAQTEARRLAERYGAEIVGSVPPLRVYQLRLPVDDLVHRDALVLRLNGEESVDSVIVEESSAEEGADALAGRGWAEEVAANRFMDAVDYYRRRIPGPSQAEIVPAPVVIGIIERAVDFDAPGFADPAPPGERTLKLYARDADDPSGHGSAVAAVVAANWDGGGIQGFLRSLDGHHAGIDVIVDRGSDAGVIANVATSVRLVQDGARVLNWSWGIHRVGATSVSGRSIDSVVRSGVAFEGYEELLEEFFKWLRREHPDVMVVNSAGNADHYSESDDYRLPSSFLTPQLLVVGAHQRSVADVAVESPRFVTGRGSSNIGERVDITAAGCVPRSAPGADDLRCGTSYSTALVTALVGAMLTINPALTPDDIRTLLRQAALPVGGDVDFEPADTEDLTAPILPSERAELLDDPDVGRSARLDMREALVLAVRSLAEG